MTPACRKCGNREVVRLSTLQRVHCTDCNTETPWLLKTDQAPLINSNRGDRRNVSDQ